MSNWCITVGMVSLMAVLHNHLVTLHSRRWLQRSHTWNSFHEAFANEIFRRKTNHGVEYIATPWTIVNQKRLCVHGINKHGQCAPWPWMATSRMLLLYISRKRHHRRTREYNVSSLCAGAPQSAWDLSAPCAWAWPLLLRCTQSRCNNDRKRRPDGVCVLHYLISKPNMPLEYWIQYAHHINLNIRYECSILIMNINAHDDIYNNNLFVLQPFVCWDSAS